MMVIEVSPYPVKVQARTHRKKRINKKWRNRYGFKTEFRQAMKSGQMIMDEIHGAGYVNTGEDVALLRRQFNEINAMRYDKLISLAAFAPTSGEPHEGDECQAAWQGEDAWRLSLLI